MNGRYEIQTTELCGELQNSPDGHLVDPNG